MDDLNNISFEMHKNYNGIYLTDSQVDILKNYGFDINKYNSIKDLMFDLEESLTYDDNDELEIILEEISEFNYYNNTNK